MTSVNGELDDESFTHLADQERRRKEKARSYGPLLRFGLIVVVIIGVVVGGGLLVRNWLHDREVRSYQTYFTASNDVIARSNEVGRKLSTLLTQPGSATRKDVQTRMDQYVQTSEDLLAEARTLRPPNEIRDVQQWLEATLDLRLKGLQDLGPSLLNALDVQDVEVPSKLISNAMMKFVLSDVAYSEFFAARANEVLKSKEIPDTSVASATFLADSNSASVDNAKELLNTLKSSENLLAIHGVGLISVIAKPSDTDIAKDGTFEIPSTDQLRFLVTMENQGTMTERDVPVTFRLQGPDNAQPQIVTVKIPEIKANETKEVEIKGINPTAYGEEALVSVEVGPVPNEKNEDNNKLEAHVTFIL